MPAKAKPYINVFHPTKPHEAQKKILDDESRFKLTRCGRKFGKTQLLTSWLMKKAIAKECLVHGTKCPAPILTFLYIAPFRDQAESIIWNDHVLRILNHIDDQMGPGWYKKNESKLSVTFPSGGQFRLFGAENSNALRGPSNWGAVVCDEYDDWPQDVWELIIRFNLGTHKAPAILAGTPRGEAGLWEKEHIEKELPDGSTERTWSTHHYTSYDNPYLDPEELQDLVAEYKGYGEDYYNQEVLAEYVKPIGTVYKEFDEKTQYVPLKYDPNQPLHVTFDFGVNDPTAIIWIQPDENGNINIIDYHEESGQTVEYFASILKGRGYHPAALYTGDPHGQSRTQLGTDPTSVVEEFKKHGIYITTLGFQPRIQDRIRATHKMMPRVRINSSNENCRRMLSVLKNYRYPQKDKKLMNQENERPIHNQWSHGASALEFYAMTAPRIAASYEDVQFPEFDRVSKDGWVL